MSKYPKSYYETYYPWQGIQWKKPGIRFAVGRALCRDKKYAQLWRHTHNVKIMENSGFFFDGFSSSDAQQFKMYSENTAHYQVPWVPLPSKEDVMKFEAEQEYVVLLCTGSFAPMHNGHLDMMAAAEKKAKELGWPVVGCYFSPSHDQYVKYKGGGQGASFSDNWRCEYAAECVENYPDKQSSWLVSPWECLGVDRPVNFTAVLHHLENYLSVQLNKKVRVVYVFGGDNADFTNVLDESSAICVTRPGYPAPETGHVALCQNTFSSTQAREEGFSPHNLQHKKHEGAYFFRDTGAWSLSAAGHETTPDLLKHWNEFKDSVIEGISGAYQTFSVRPSSYIVMDLQTQRTLVEQWIESSPYPVFNLDSCTNDIPGQFALNFSRVFSLDGFQKKSKDLRLRPNGIPLNVSDLPINKVVLVDDDCCSGYTLTKAKEWLKNNEIDVVDARFILEQERKWVKVFDVLDLHDFLPGSHNAGLVIEHPLGKVDRFAYVAPFVNLHHRAKIPMGKSWELSYHILKACRKLYAQINRPESEMVTEMLFYLTKWNSNR